MSGKYFDGWGADVAWREDKRRYPTSWLCQALLAMALTPPVGWNLGDYWEGHKPTGTLAWEPYSSFVVEGSGHSHSLVRASSLPREIGRASCRERMCQYV